MRTREEDRPWAHEVRSVADLPADFRSWPHEVARNRRGVIYRDPENTGRTVRIMQRVQHQGADPAKRSRFGYVRYTDGRGGMTPPMPADAPERSTPP